MWLEQCPSTNRAGADCSSMVLRAAQKLLCLALRALILGNAEG